MLNRLWIFISHVGVKDGYPLSVQKNIILTNQYTIIGFIVFFLGGFNNIRLGDLSSFLIAEIFGVLSLTGFIFTAKGYYQFTMSFIVLLVSIAAFLMDAYLGREAGVYLYYYPVILGIAFAFDVRKDKWRIMIHFLIITIFIVFNLVNKNPLFDPPDIPANKYTELFVFSVVFSVLSVAFFGYLSIDNHLKLNNLYETRDREREKANRQIADALKQKDILFTELHHRVKNNLAVIVGLFNLKIHSMRASEARNILIESRNRILSMALIHNRLYKSTNLDHIDFKEFMFELVEEVEKSFPQSSKNVEVFMEIEKYDMHINQAIPCGLILNELLSNAYKHAFKEKENGEIKIRFTNVQNGYHLEVSDNGTGFEKDVVSESVGLSIVEALADQLGATYSFKKKNGTHFLLDFKNDENSVETIPAAKS